MNTTTNKDSAMTQKEINLASSQLNKEFSNLFGCLKAMVALKDSTSKDTDIEAAKKALKVLGLNTKKDVEVVAGKVLANYPLQGVDINSDKIIAFEVVTKRKPETKESYKVTQPVTKWTFKKVLKAVRVMQGTKEITKL